MTFLARGDGGNTTNLPPTVFLEGVNTTPIPAPEPAPCLHSASARAASPGWLSARRQHNRAG